MLSIVTRAKGIMHKHITPRIIGTAALAPTVAVASAVTAFASVNPDPPLNVPRVTITNSMLQPLIDAVVANLAMIIPAGIGLFGILFAIKLIPRVFSSFMH